MIDVSPDRPLENQYQYWWQAVHDKTADVWFGVPHRMRHGLAAYLLLGRTPGHFLSALLSNDLMGCLARGDDENVRILPEYGKFLYNRTPNGSYGSREHFIGWLNSGGILGQDKAAKASDASIGMTEAAIGEHKS